MKIRLIKDWTKPSGSKIGSGKNIIVTQELGRDLIREKIGVKDEIQENNVKFEEIITKKVVKKPSTKSK